MSNALTLAAMVAMYALGLFFGYGVGVDETEAQAIKAECAQYNPQSGDFEWLEGER